MWKGVTAPTQPKPRVPDPPGPDIPPHPQRRGARGVLQGARDEALLEDRGGDDRHERRLQECARELGARGEGDLRSLPRPASRLGRCRSGVHRAVLTHGERRRPQEGTRARRRPWPGARCRTRRIRCAGGVRRSGRNGWNHHCDLSAQRRPDRAYPKPVTLNHPMSSLDGLSVACLNRLATSLDDIAR